MKASHRSFEFKIFNRGVVYYVTVLGFKADFHEPGIIASVSRGRCGIFLTEGPGKPGSLVVVGVSDVDALFEEYRNKRARIRNPPTPTNYSWAWEMQVEDLDVLRFGSEPKKDQPFGEWLDMRGIRWAPASIHGWRRVEG